MNRLPTFILACALCAVASSAAAQESTEWELKTHEATRADTPPTIDGSLDDDVWQKAPVITGLVNRRTDALSKQQTNIRFLYDDVNIYVSFECFEDPDTIVAVERKYDRSRIFSEDVVQVSLDTFHDREQSYMFSVTPLGTRLDMRSGPYGRNLNWDADWQAETRILEDRWIAEMAIPIGVMHFNQADDQTWGANFFRDDQESNEFSRWSYDPSIGQFIKRFGTITNLDLANVKPVTAPQLETYASITATKRDGGDLHSRWSAGLDLETRLNSNWVSTFTVNPDFGQVDADTDTIALRDTERFLPERRPFFKEGAQLFETPIRLYNSRRISDIEVGAKITGSGKDWTFAGLDIQGTGTRSGDANILVTRYTQKLNDDLQVGGMFQNILRNDGENIVASADARYQVSDSITWDNQVAYMFDRSEQDDPGQSDERLNEYAFRSEIGGGTKPWFWDLSFNSISEEFQPDLGFISRDNIIGPTGSVNYFQDVDTGPVEAYGAFLWAAHYQNQDGRTTLRDYFFNSFIHLRNNWDFSLNYSDNFHDPYDNYSHRVEVEYNRQNRYKSFELGYSWGEFQETDYQQISFEKPFKLGNRFTAELDADYRLEEEDNGNEDEIWLLRLVNEYTFEWEGRVKLTLEESSEDRYNRTLLFAYEDVGDWDFYLVLNDIDDSENVIRGAFTKFVYRW